MPYSYATYTGNGATTQFALTFPYIRKEHVFVSVAYVNQAYTWVNDSTVQLATAPANGARVEVRRVTPVTAPLVDFTDGSTLVAADLDTNALQQVYTDQEQEDQLKQAIYVDPNGNLTASNQRLKNILDPVDAQDVSTKNYVDTRDALKVSKTGDSMTGALAMGANKVTGVADPTAAQDAATKNYVDTNDALKVSKTGDSMTGALAMGNNKITGVGTPTLSTDAATKGYVDTFDNLKVNRAGDSMNGPIDMGSYKITSTYTPGSGPDLTNKTYVDSVVNNGVPTGDKGDITVTNLGATWTVDNGAITPAKLSTGGPYWSTTGGVGINNQAPILAQGLSFTDTIPSSFAGANRISFGATGGFVRNGIGVSGFSPGTFVSYIADGSHAFYNHLSGTLQQIAQLDKRLMLGGVGTYSFAGTTRLVVQGNNVNDTTEGIIDLIRGSNASTGNALGRIQFRDNYATPQSHYASIGCVAEAGPSPINYLGALTFSTNTTNSNTPLERMRIDSSGRMLVGTSTASGYSSARMIVTGAGTDATGAGNLVLQIGQANGSVTSGEQIGTITFGDTSGFSYATIEAAADLTAGSDSPGRLVFSTTADGASSPTERFRIANNGAWGLAGANYGSSGEVLTSNGSGSAPTWQAAGGVGSLKAWVNFNGTGTVAIRGNGNVSSITDNGTGDYTVNFTTAMPDANYAAFASPSGEYAVNYGGQTGMFSTGSYTESAPATGSARVTFSNYSSGTFDPKYVNFAVFR